MSKHVDTVMKQSLATFLREFYGNGRRKGLQKLNLSHPLDVLEFADIEGIEDVELCLLVYRTSLLHDIVEDSHWTAEDLREMFGLDEKEADVLNLLSRNVMNKDGSSYLEGIMGNPGAVIVKLADRIANISDLMLWISSVRGFTETSLRMTEKYLKEHEELLRLFKDTYETSFRGGPYVNIARQWSLLENRVTELERLYHEFKGSLLLKDNDVGI